MSIGIRIMIKWALCNILGALIVIAVALGLASIVKTQLAYLSVAIIAVIYFLACIVAVVSARPDHDNKMFIWVLVGISSPVVILSVLLKPSSWDFD